MLCGEGVTMVSERVHHSDLTILLSGVFCFIAVLGIVLVRRDIRTLYAFMIATTGAVMVMTSVAWSGGLALYYAGTLMIFLGVWLNSSLLYVLKRIGWVRIPEMSRAISK
jgi:energy-converting hydrogenase Eha subunit C